MPGPATNAARICRPSSVRIGMFCRFGSHELSRPVAAVVWDKLVCTRPVSREINFGSESTYVPFELLTQLAKLNNLRRHRMLVRQVFQHIRRRRPHAPLAAPERRLQIQFVEQNFGQLRRRVHIELNARHLPNFFLEPANFLLHRDRHRVERLRIDTNPLALQIRKHCGKWQIDFFVRVRQPVRFNVLLQQRRHAMQIVRAFARPSTQNHVELPHYDVGEIVGTGRGPQQVGINLRRVLNIFRAPAHNLEQLGVVHDLRPLRILQQRHQRRERFALLVHPDRAAFARLRRNLDRCNARTESFRLALARFQIQPNRNRRFRRQLRQIRAKFIDVRKLRVIGLHRGLLRRRRSGRRFRSQLLQHRIESQLAIQRRQQRRIGISAASLFSSSSVITGTSIATRASCTSTSSLARVAAAGASL